MAKPPDYRGQPRRPDGKFGRGKQSGSKARGRSVGGTSQRTAGIFSPPPFHAPKPDHRPGEGRIGRFGERRRG